MAESYSKKWIWATYVSQILTGAIHSLSFFKNPEPANETEKQMYDLMMNYKRDLGAGFSPTTMDLFTALSACMTMLCLLSGLSLWWLSRHNTGKKEMRGIMAINTVIFGVGFAIMLMLTFLPPIVCFGVIFFAAAGGYISLSARPDA